MIHKILANLLSSRILNTSFRKQKMVLNLVNFSMSILPNNREIHKCIDKILLQNIKLGYDAEMLYIKLHKIKEQIFFIASFLLVSQLLFNLGNIFIPSFPNSNRHFICVKNTMFKQSDNYCSEKLVRKCLTRLGSIFRHYHFGCVP